MNGSAWLPILFVALALVLPVSALLRRRVGFSKIAIMALVWAAIFVAVTLAIGLLSR